MDKQPGPQPTPEKPAQRPRLSTGTTFLLLVLGLVLLFLMFAGGEKRERITYGEFRRELQAGNVAKVDVQGARINGAFKQPPKTAQQQSAEKKPSGTKEETSAQTKPKPEDLEFYTELPKYLVGQTLDAQLYAELKDDYDATEPSDGSVTWMVIYIGVMIALFVGLWLMIRRTRDQFLGGGILSSFGKSPAKRYQTGGKPVTFDDVAGLEGVKHELEEVVEFLKNPKKFERLGGRVPKGILMMGPPGSGKTLLGRAVAGEAGVPFFSINGSEFIQMFVGVGASRVRDLFSTAKESAPSILFIDEIDAVGRHRGAGLGGGHDEREQTLNQILSEMDGFLQTESVIVMAATNRPDVLDPALLRPGRFDRHIVVDRPNHKGRAAIFKVHTRDVPLGDDVDFETLAASSTGLTGADIRNMVNEAALWASRQDKEKVDMADFDYARDKVLMGVKREEVLSDREKAMTAYHESGHVLLAWLEAVGDRVHKVSIIPRGRSLGATQLLPEEDRLNIGESEIHKRLLFLLGGRAAEKLAFDELTAGAEDDLNRATQLARRMITHWGMSDKLGPVAFRDGDEHPFLGKEMAEPRRFSEHTAQVIDEEVVRILREASTRADSLLSEHRDKLDLLAEALQREETLDADEIEKLIGPPAYKKAEGEAKA